MGSSGVLRTAARGLVEKRREQARVAPYKVPKRTVSAPESSKVDNFEWLPDFDHDVREKLEHFGKTLDWIRAFGVEQQKDIQAHASELEPFLDHEGAPAAGRIRRFYFELKSVLDTTATIKKKAAAKLRQKKTAEQHRRREDEEERQARGRLAWTRYRNDGSAARERSRSPTPRSEEDPARFRRRDRAASRGRAFGSIQSAPPSLSASVAGQQSIIKRRASLQGPSKDLEQFSRQYGTRAPSARRTITYREQEASKAIADASVQIPTNDLTDIPAVQHSHPGTATTDNEHDSLFSEDSEPSMSIANGSPCTRDWTAGVQAQHDTASNAESERTAVNDNAERDGDAVEGAIRRILAQDTTATAQLQASENILSVLTSPPEHASGVDDEESERSSSELQWTPAPSFEEGPGTDDESAEEDVNGNLEYDEAMAAAIQASLNDSHPQENDQHASTETPAPSDEEESESDSESSAEALNGTLDYDDAVAAAIKASIEDHSTQSSGEQDENQQGIHIARSPTDSKHKVDPKADSFECASCAVLRDSYDRSNAFSTLCSWCDEATKFEAGEEYMYCKQGAHSRPRKDFKLLDGTELETCYVCDDLQYHETWDGKTTGKGKLMQK